MSDRQGQNRISSSQGWITGRILLGYFLLAANIAVEKWLLESYSLLEINFVTAALFMMLTAFHCLLYTSPSPRDVEESRMPSSA